MPIRHAIWTVSTQPEQLTVSSLNDDQLLEKMIIAEPRIVSDELMLIGRQEATGFNGRIDLLAIAPDGSLVLIELKRDRTPREVVAQALDYATWVDKLKPEDITAIYERFAPKKSLMEDFRNRFKQPLEEDTLNQNHQIIIIAASLDDSTERIINYLNQRDGAGGRESRLSATVESRIPLAAFLRDFWKTRHEFPPGKRSGPRRGLAGNP